MRTLSKERILEIPCGYVFVKDYLSSDTGQALFVEDKMTDTSS